MINLLLTKNPFRFNYVFLVLVSLGSFCGSVLDRSKLFIVDNIHERKTCMYGGTLGVKG